LFIRFVKFYNTNLKFISVIEAFESIDFEGKP